MATQVNGTRRITTHEAQIKTATVELRVLTINGKQVTQAVFWQLEKEDLIDGETAELGLRGVPWGRMNYYRSPCQDDHLHIVWQKGTELRRACVSERGYRGCSVYAVTAAEAGLHIGELRTWQLVQGMLPMDGSRHPVRPDAYRHAGLCVSYVKQGEFWADDGVRLVYCMPQWAEDALRFNLAGHQHDADAHVQRMSAQYGTPAALEAVINGELESLRAIQGRWAQRWAELRALDQLFIAV
jgi:hypothetical protein